MTIPNSVCTLKPCCKEAKESACHGVQTGPGTATHRWNLCAECCTSRSGRQRRWRYQWQPPCPQVVQRGCRPAAPASAAVSAAPAAACSPQSPPAPSMQRFRKHRSCFRSSDHNPGNQHVTWLQCGCRRLRLAQSVRLCMLPHIPTHIHGLLNIPMR